MTLEISRNLISSQLQGGSSEILSWLAQKVSFRGLFTSKIDIIDWLDCSFNIHCLAQWMNESTIWDAITRPIYSSSRYNLKVHLHKPNQLKLSSPKANHNAITRLLWSLTHNDNNIGISSLKAPPLDMVNSPTRRAVVAITCQHSFLSAQTISAHRPEVYCVKRLGKHGAAGSRQRAGYFRSCNVFLCQLPVFERLIGNVCLAPRWYLTNWELHLVTGTYHQTPTMFSAVSTNDAICIHNSTWFLCDLWLALAPLRSPCTRVAQSWWSQSLWKTRAPEKWWSSLLMAISATLAEELCERTDS